MAAFPGENGNGNGALQPGTLLQDTVEQFEKVIDLERALLKKSIMKLEREHEEASTELSMKEEELFIWEEKLQQVQQDNETKLKLAKQRLQSGKYKTPHGRSPSIPARGASLGFIEECEEEEDEEEDHGANATAADAAVDISSINALALEVVEEMAELRKLWFQLERSASQQPPSAPLPASTEAPAVAPSPKPSELASSFDTPVDRVARCYQHLDEMRAKARRMKEESSRPLVQATAPKVSALAAAQIQPVMGMSASVGVRTPVLGERTFPMTMQTAMPGNPAAPTRVVSSMTQGYRQPPYQPILARRNSP